jgi:hypothetical protein
VQVVASVVTADQFSDTLSTEHTYHHGYWDGFERELRGFGRVDQFEKSCGTGNRKAAREFKWKFEAEAKQGILPTKGRKAPTIRRHSANLRIQNV